MIGTDSAHATDTQGTYLGVHGAELANHHVALRPDEPTRIIIKGVGDYRPVMPWVKVIDLYEMAGIRESRILAALSSLDGQVYMLQHDGTAVDVTTSVSTNAGKLFNSPPSTYVTAAAVEPDRRLGANANIEAAILSPNATRISQLLVTDNGVLKTGTEAGLFPFLTSNFTPPARTSPVVVYSRVAGGVFVLGGRNTSTGVPYQDLWFIRLGRTWGQIPLTGYAATGDVLAATYSFTDQRLWVASLDGAGGVAIHRIDPTTGQATRHGTWAYSGTYSRYGFSVDHDGAVLLFSKQASGGAKLAKVIIDGTGKAVASLIDRDEPGLNRAPIVDENGYSFLHDNNTTERVNRPGFSGGSNS